MMHVAVPAQSRPAEELARAYMGAWNAHDGAAVAAVVTGSYVDPTLSAPLRGAAVAEMVDALCAAFRDLRFEETALPLVVGDQMVLQWRMRGTNSGAPLPGAPTPTGGTVDLPGVDVVTLAQHEWPDLADGEDAELLSRSQEVVMAVAGEPGFLGFRAMTVGVTLQHVDDVDVARGGRGGHRACPSAPGGHGARPAERLRTSWVHQLLAAVPHQRAEVAVPGLRVVDRCR